MGKSKGYIKLYRDLQDNALWKSETFTKGQAWVDLLLMANHIEKNFLLGNEIIKAEIGSVITSELKLMEKWKWSKKKLRSYLKLLEEFKMIKRLPDRKKTVIKILNYSEYQLFTMSEQCQEEKWQKETASNPLKSIDSG